MISSLPRWIKHLCTLEWQVRKLFPDGTMEAITQAIRESEKTHRGQIQVVIEGALNAKALWRGISAHSRAMDLFSRLKIWDTAENNGVLIYMVLADHEVVIVADRGIHHKVSPDVWPRACQEMEAEFTQGRYLEGCLAGIHAVTQTLRHHFPAQHSHDTGANELDDRPLLL